MKTKEEILFWLEKYPHEVYPLRIENELRKKFRKNKFVTKYDLERIVKWKFRTDKLRRNKVLGFLEKYDDKTIKTVTKAAFEVQKDDKLRLKLLASIGGITNIIATTILAFYEPERYGIMDDRVWEELYGEGSKPKNYDLISANKCLMYLENLKAIAIENNITVRDVERAYFSKNYWKSRGKQKSIVSF
jgi:hypothetical protein